MEAIHIGCSPNDELAVLLNTECQAILPASGCENFWADVDITSLDGLQYIEYENFMVTQITGATGTQTCPYDQNAKGGSFDCSYYGMGTGSGSLTQGELKLVTQSIEVQLKCPDLITQKPEHYITEALPVLRIILPLQPHMVFVRATAKASLKWEL